MYTEEQLKQAFEYGEEHMFSKMRGLPTIGLSFEDFKETLVKESNVINWNSVEDKLPDLTEENRYGKYSKYMLCRLAGGYLESCMLNEGEDERYPYWSYEQDGDLCDTVTHWASVNLPC